MKNKILENHKVKTVVIVDQNVDVFVGGKE